ncbi:MAG: TerB family tellurite resistance protein [Planctomycetaceae bacterium]|nr:TerB family tellurite resistance protein [Planctomycetaceae bacterium]
MDGMPIELYFAVLACVARADGRVTQEERHVIRSAAQAAGLTGDVLARLERLLDMATPFSSEDVLAEIAPGMTAATLAEAIRDAYVLAAADQEIAPAEVAVIDRLFALVGIAEHRRPALHEWARRAAEHHLDGLALLSEALPKTNHESAREDVHSR